MHIEIEELSWQNLATVFLVSLIWHSGGTLVAQFAAYQTNSPPAASQQVANNLNETVHPVEQPFNPHLERVLQSLDALKVTSSYDRINEVAAVPRNFQDRWPMSEPKRAATPFERRGRFDTKI